MAIGEICSRDVVYVTKDTGLPQAAELMRKYHVGALVVVEESGGKRYPVGILTDRDIAVCVVAADVEPRSLDVGDVVGPELFLAQEHDGVWETLQRMRQHGVRRLPVVRPDQSLLGIVTLDDLLELVAGELADMVKIIRQESAREERLRPQ